MPTITNRPSVTPNPNVAGTAGTQNVGTATNAGTPGNGQVTQDGGTVPAGGGNTVNARKVVIGGLGTVQNSVGASSRSARDPSFDTYSATGTGAVSRGFLKTNATPIPGGCRLQVDTYHSSQNDAMMLYLVAEVCDTKTNQLRTITLSVLANKEVLNQGSFRGTQYYDVNYDEVNKFLQQRNPNLKLTPGVTNLAVAAYFPTGHQAGGFGRGGVFRLPPAANATSLVGVRQTTAARGNDNADLPLDMQVNYPPQLVQAVPKLKPDGAILSRLESELKGCTSKQDMLDAVKEAYRLTGLVHGGKDSDVEKILGKDWTIEPVDRYWLKDDGSANQPGKAGTGQFKGFRVDDRGWPMQDPMHDVYMDDANLGMTAHEGAIRLRSNKTATEINVKPGGGRRDDKTKITQRIEYGLVLNPGSNVADAAQVLQQINGNGNWNNTVFNAAQKEVSRLDPNLNLSTALVPWLDVVQERHKFTVKNKKTGVEIELSLDFVKATTTRPQHANPDGTPRVIEFCVLEAELDHLQLQSQNQSSFVAAAATASSVFTTDAQQDQWLKTTTTDVTMDVDPRLHEIKDLDNDSFRQTASYKAFEGVSGRMLGGLFPNGLDSGRQKAAHAAELLNIVCFDDKQLMKGAESMVTSGGYKWTPAMEQAFQTAMQNPPMRQRINNGIASGQARLNTWQWVQQTIGTAVPLEYDAAKLKDRVRGKLESLGLTVDAQALAMFDAATTQRIAPNYLESYLQQMANYQDAQALSQFAQLLGVNPAPQPKVDSKKLFASTEFGAAIVARNLETAAVDAKIVPDVQKFLDKAFAAGMTAYEARQLVANLASNPQTRLDQIGQQRGLQAEVPKLHASAKALATRAEPLLKGQYLAMNDALRTFLEKVAASRNPQEALNWVQTLQNGADNVLEAEAKRLGVPKPKVDRDWATIDTFLQQYTNQQLVQYDDDLKKLVRAAVEGGVPVQNLARPLQMCGQMSLSQALKQSGIYLVGVTVPDVKYDAAATEQRILQNLAGYTGALSGGPELKKFVATLLSLGATPAQVQNYSSYAAQNGKNYGAQQLSQIPATSLPMVPIDVAGLCNALQARFGASWTPAIDAFLRANMQKALDSGAIGLAHIWNQQPRQAAVYVAQHSGVPLAAGI